MKKRTIAERKILIVLGLEFLRQRALGAAIPSFPTTMNLSKEAQVQRNWVANRLRNLSNMGLLIAVDDFGGYAVTPAGVTAIVNAVHLHHRIAAADLKGWLGGLQVP